MSDEVKSGDASKMAATYNNARSDAYQLAPPSGKQDSEARTVSPPESKGVEGSREGASSEAAGDGRVNSGNKEFASNENKGEKSQVTGTAQSLSRDDNRKQNSAGDNLWLIIFLSLIFVAVVATGITLWRRRGRRARGRNAVDPRQYNTTAPPKGAGTSAVPRQDASVTPYRIISWDTPRPAHANTATATAGSVNVGANIHFENVNKELDSLARRLQILCQNLDRYFKPQERIADLESRLSQLQSERNGLQDQANRLQMRVEKQERAVQQYEATIINLQSDLKKQRELIDLKEGEIQRMRTELGEWNRKIKDLEAEKSGEKAEKEQWRHKYERVGQLLPVCAVEKAAAEVEGVLTQRPSQVSESLLRHIMARIALLKAASAMPLPPAEKYARLREEFLSLDQALYFSFREDQELLKSVRSALSAVLQGIVGEHFRFRWPEKGEAIDRDKHIVDPDTGGGVILEVKSAAILDTDGALLVRAKVSG